MSDYRLSEVGGPDPEQVTGESKVEKSLTIKGARLAILARRIANFAPLIVRYAPQPPA